jgi:hypothetical protein
MKKFFRIKLRTLGILVVLIGITAAYIQIKGIPTYPELTAAIPKDFKVVSTPKKIARGVKIASMLCSACHLSQQEQRFSSKELLDITQDTAKGIGNWTDGELLYFLRTGIRSDGSFAFFMPKFPVSREKASEFKAWMGRNYICSTRTITLLNAALPVKSSNTNSSVKSLTLAPACCSAISKRVPLRVCP